MQDHITLAHEASFMICGREYVFSRAFDMLRRAEAAIGPVAPFALKLDARGARSDEIARVYNAFLRDVAGAPTQEEVAAWVFERGLLHRDLAAYLFSLTLGSDELERVGKSRGLNAEQDRPGEPARGPFAPTDSQTGISFSDLAAAWDGPHPKPGPVRFSR